MIDIIINSIIVLAKCTGLLLMIMGFGVVLYTFIALIIYIREEYKIKGDKDNEND